jgi:site-specific recombinase XerD
VFGHSSVRTTERYVNITPTSLRDIMKPAISISSILGHDKK